MRRHKKTIVYHDYFAGLDYLIFFTVGLFCCSFATADTEVSAEVPCADMR